MLLYVITVVCYICTDASLCHHSCMLYMYGCFFVSPQLYVIYVRMLLYVTTVVCYICTDASLCHHSCMLYMYGCFFVSPQLYVIYVRMLLYVTIVVCYICVTFGVYRFRAAYIDGCSALCVTYRCVTLT